MVKENYWVRWGQAGFLWSIWLHGVSAAGLEDSSFMLLVAYKGYIQNLTSCCLSWWLGSPKTSRFAFLALRILLFRSHHAIFAALPVSVTLRANLITSSNCKQKINESQIWKTAAYCCQIGVNFGDWGHQCIPSARCCKYTIKRCKNTSFVDVGSRCSKYLWFENLYMH